jgi:hypothetical protein
MKALLVWCELLSSATSGLLSLAEGIAAGALDSYTMIERRIIVNSPRTRLPDGHDQQIAEPVPQDSQHSSGQTGTPVRND